MTSPTPEQFAEFFRAVYEKEPFPWQRRLAARVCDPARGWPRAIALPTAAGKTGCIDIAVFALACRREGPRQPRRIFFVVDRRVVVDQAWMHATKLAEVLRDARGGILKQVAESLRALAGEEGARPLDVYALRGGMYRESAWARSPLQPTVIASTVDQVGSRLLFRGYGVSDSMTPVHAGLVGNDALILLDEAHCAKPFDQTMQAVKSYRAWGDEPNPAPFQFVSLTATPTDDVLKDEAAREKERPSNPKLIERDEDEDRAHPALGARIKASKPAALVVAEKAKGKEWGKWGPPLVEALATEARKLMGAELGEDAEGREHAVRAVGVIVNRVATARKLAELLRTPPAARKGQKPEGEPAKVILLTGRMRPLDRDRVLRDLEPLFSGKGGEVPPVYVVATQCLEVGADLDFHALVTECASLDALRQRFGRLNRVAARPGAKAAVVVRADQTAPAEKEENADPVYGNALANTWQWLNANATGGVFDFGVSAVRALTEGADLSALNAPSKDAPVLFPAHLDCWVQTNPVPTPEPDVSLFLHGPKEARQPDVQVVFRADLGGDASKWAEVVSLCPPSSSEAVSVPIGVFRKWLADELEADDTADVEGDATAEPDERGEDDRERQARQALRWRGPEEGEEKTKIVSAPADVTPNGTYVVPIPPAGDARERDAIGRLADLLAGLTDYGDEAFRRSRDKAVLRFTPAVVASWPEPFRTEGARALAEFTAEGGEEEVEDRDEFAARLDDVLDGLAAAELSGDALREWEWLREAAAALARPERERKWPKVTHRDLDRHPAGGVVLTGRDRLRQFDPTHLDDTEPAESFRGRQRGGREVTLEEHARGVAAFASRFAAGCGLDSRLYEQAGLWHDLGKLDPRFQAMLKQCSPRTAVGEPLAKSARPPRTREEARAARAVHRYPTGARHELLSAALVAAKAGDGGADDLLLHLIATHHGSARPFAAAVEENDAAVGPFEPPALFGEEFRLPTCAQQVRDWNAELSERFWRVVRRYGWWGAAYREAVFRLADHAQSAAEQEGTASLAGVGAAWAGLPAKVIRRDLHALPLPGLDGSNPLGFLAALGTLRLADRAFPGAALGWEDRSPPTAVLHLPVKKSPDEFASALLQVAGSARRCLAFADDLKIPADQFREFQREARDASRTDREFADFLSAYADPLITVQGGPNVGKTKPTELYFIAGRQQFLEQVQKIVGATASHHLTKCLFSSWVYDDPLDGLSLRWDPMDDSRYATRWRNPSGDPARKRGGSVLGANWLAFESLPLFPCFANGTRLTTTGFAVMERRAFFTWRLWQPAWGVDAVRSVLSVGRSRGRTRLGDRFGAEHLGVVAQYRCEKVANSDYSNFALASVV
jgi:CRISPR-associated endonuclease/helicase Cas3